MLRALGHLYHIKSNNIGQQKKERGEKKILIYIEIYLQYYKAFSKNSQYFIIYSSFKL